MLGFPTYTHKKTSSKKKKTQKPQNSDELYTTAEDQKQRQLESALLHQVGVSISKQNSHVQSIDNKSQDKDSLPHLHPFLLPKRCVLCLTKPFFIFQKRKRTEEFGEK